MKRASALDKIVSAFADSVADGDFDGAEGWLTLARDHADRLTFRESGSEPQTRQPGRAPRA